MESSERLSITGLTALGAAIRLAGIAHQPLWLDEATSVAFAKRPLAGTFFAEISHPPLFRTMLHGWIHIAGTSEIAVRFPSLVFGVSAIPIFYLLARRLTARPGTILATLIVAVSPYEVWFSQEARNYALLFLATVLSTWLLLRLIEKPGPRRATLYGLAVVLGLATHYFFWFVLAAHGVYTLITNPRRTLWVAAPAAAGVLLFVPWGMWVYAHWQPQPRPWMPPPWMGLESAFYRMSAGYGTGVMNVLKSPTGWGGMWEDSTVAWLAPPLILLVACVLGIRGLGRRSAILVFAALAVPVVCLIGLYEADGTSLAADRTLIITSPFLYLLAGAGIAALPRVPSRCLLGVLLAVFAVELLTVSFDPDVGKEQWNEVAQWVDRRAAPGDVVLVHKPYIDVAVDYYRKGSWPTIGIWAPTRKNLDLLLAEPIVRRASHVFLVVSHNWWDTKGKWPKLLATVFRRTAFHLFPKNLGIRVEEMERK